MSQPGSWLYSSPASHSAQLPVDLQACSFLPRFLSTICTGMYSVPSCVRSSALPETDADDTADADGAVDADADADGAVLVL